MAEDGAGARLDPVAALLERADQPDVEPCASIAVLSAWPLFTVTIERGPDGEDQVYFHAGGQGVWSARMAKVLGAASTLIGPFGGETGRVARMLLEDEGVALRAIEVAGWNGGYVCDRRGGERRNIADMPAPRLTRHEVDDLYNAVLTQALRGDAIVLTGIGPVEVLPKDLIAQLAHDLAARGSLVVADVSGDMLEPMRGGLAALKLSEDTLLEAGLAEDGSDAAVAACIRRLAESAARLVVVSRAGKGALAAEDGRVWSISQPRFTPLDPTGGGDSMTAALAVALATGMGAEDALRLAAAAAGANVTRRGRGTGQPQDILERARHVEIVLREDL